MLNPSTETPIPITKLTARQDGPKHLHLHVCKFCSHLSTLHLNLRSHELAFGTCQRCQTNDTYWRWGWNDTAGDGGQNWQGAKVPVAVQEGESNENLRADEWCEVSIKAIERQAETVEVGLLLVGQLCSQLDVLSSSLLI